MKLGESKHKDIVINFNLPSGLSNDCIIDTYIDIRDNVMLIRLELLNIF